MSLYHGDCLEVLPTLPPASVEAIITDLPYGTTACAWDSIIPLAPMWEAVKRVLKPAGLFVTTSAQPFTSFLITSNIEWFRQEMIWDKVLPVGFLDAKRRHMRAHENIVLFSPIGYSTFNPQMVTRGKPRMKGGTRSGALEQGVYHSYAGKKSFGNEYYPTTIITVSNGDRTRPEVGFHPTQKPVKLMEYLLRTFTNPGETVLDICMGSGSTGVACVQTGRKFIGIEKEQKYFEIAESRIAQAHPPLFTEAATPANNRLHLDVGDSPAQQALFTPEADTAEGKLPAPAPRR